MNLLTCGVVSSATPTKVDLVVGSVEIPPEVPSLAGRHASRDADAPAATPARHVPLSATSSSLESFVVPGGLHPIADESNAKRPVSIFLRRVWRDGALFNRGPADK